MLRQSPIRLLGAVRERPSDDLLRLAAAALVFVVATAVVSLPAGGRAASWTAFWSTVAASIESQPSNAAVRPRLFGQDNASRANDDGYLQGLAKALNQDL
jgi:hypothetical protein